MSLMLGPTGPAPLWATGCEGESVDRPQICEPSVKEFQRFVIALARRYSGSYVDENGGVLPRVGRWSIWNEPNQGGWLQPQWERRRGRWVPAAAQRYRDLFAASVRGLRKNGHPRDQVLIGETAPLGRRSGAMYKRSTSPVRFWRALLCIDSRGRKLRGTEAKLIGCSKPRPLDAQGAAHHPYTRGGGKHPRTSRIYGDEITIAYLSRLRRELDRAARHKRIRRGMPIYSTEFGFQTDPPDDLIGVSPGTAARWMNEANWIAYNDSRVRGVAQYELRDAQDVASFQTGLRFHDGRAKPSLEAYRIPIWVVRSRKYFRVWGQVRPASRARGSRSSSDPARRGSGCGRWSSAARAATSMSRRASARADGASSGERRTDRSSTAASPRQAAGEAVRSRTDGPGASSCVDIFARSWNLAEPPTRAAGGTR